MKTTTTTDDECLCYAWTVGRRGLSRTTETTESDLLKRHAPARRVTRFFLQLEKSEPFLKIKTREAEQTDRRTGDHNDA
jgi:hypothetical protein